MPEAAVQAVRGTVHVAVPYVVAVHDTIVRVAASDAHAIHEGWTLGVAILAALATVAYFVATVLIFQQTNRALRVNRETLEQNRAVLETMRVTGFEDGFFRLLTLLQDILRELHYEHGSTHGAGRRGLKLMAADLMVLGTHRGPRPLADVHEDFFTRGESILGHYFHTLYRIVRHVDLAPAGVHKPTYIKIIRAQLSQAELLLLFYFCMRPSPAGAKLKHMAEVYGLFEDVQDAWLIDAGHHSTFAPSAFNSG